MEDYQDFILPTEGEEDAPPQAEEQVESPVEDTKPAEEPQKIKLKYNHEEKELSLDEVIPLAQKGMNYDKIMEKLNTLQSNPALSFVEQQAQRHGLTVEQYIEAVKKAEEEEQLNELIQKNIPEEYAKEILENKKFREQMKAEQRAKEQKEKENTQYMEFLEAFPNVKPEEINPETWTKFQKGIPLKYAYMEQERQSFMDRIKVLEQNIENIKKAPITGITDHGSEETAEVDPFIRGFDSIK